MRTMLCGRLGAAAQGPTRWELRLSTRGVCTVLSDLGHRSLSSLGLLPPQTAEIHLSYRTLRVTVLSGLQTQDWNLGSHPVLVWNCPLAHGPQLPHHMGDCSAPWWYKAQSPLQLGRMVIARAFRGYLDQMFPKFLFPKNFFHDPDMITVVFFFLIF